MKNKQYIEKEIQRPIVFEKTFSPDVDGQGVVDSFSAVNKARAYLDQFGIDQGSMERDNPIGLAKSASISKWTRLLGYDGGRTFNDRIGLDGVMLSDDFRDGAVIVLLAYNPEEAK